MSEDQKNGVPFESLGEPTRADAAAVWNSMKKPSIRTVVEKMKARGWKTSISTIQRWSAEGFVDPKEGADPAKAVQKAKKANKKANEAIAKFAETSPMKDNPAIREALSFEPSKIKDLVTDTKESLKDKLEKLTMAVSIVALEQFALKSEALVLMPAESGKFLSSIAEVATAIKPAGEIAPGDGKSDLKMIESQAIEERPVSPLASKIAQFRKEQSLAVVK